MITLPEHEIHRRVTDIEKSSDQPLTKARKLLEISRPLKHQLKNLEQTHHHALETESREVRLRLERLDQHLQGTLKSVRAAAKRSLAKEKLLKFETTTSYGGPVFAPLPKLLGRI